jgi:hypothetical protein
LVTNGIKLVSLSEFLTCPIWRYDEDDDLYYAVNHGKDLPESERDISILVECKTNSGHKFMGYVVGIEKVFSMAIFFEEKTFHVNKNLPDLSAKQMKALLMCAGFPGKVTVEQLFPIEYTTQIMRSEFKEFSGKFEVKFS